MSITSRSPRKVARVALAVGERSLPRYAHKFAPKSYTQAQLLACLVIKAFWSADYRTAAAWLEDHPTLCADLGLRRVPHYTTLQKAQRRLLRFDLVRSMLGQSAGLVLHRRRVIERAAGDSSGFEAGRISPYFVRRRVRGQKNKVNPHYQTTRYTKFPKLAIIADCHTHLILAAWPTRGPTPDVHQLLPLLGQMTPAMRVERLLLDAGYDSEANHRHLREACAIKSYIPPKHGRPTTKPATGKHRRHMQRLFTDANRRRINFGQRWQVETVFSMIKRNLDHAVASQTYWSQCRDMLLLALTHNVMIARQTKGFLQSTPDPFYSAFLPCS